MPTEPREAWGDLATTAFVQASALFGSLDEDARADLMKLALVQAFSAGEVVVAQGQGGDDFFMVRDGLATVTAERDGKRVELAVLDRGACFGEFVVLGDPARTATVSARTDLVVVRFPAGMVAALGERFPRVKKLLAALREARRRDGEAKAAGDA